MAVFVEPVALVEEEFVGMTSMYVAVMELRAAGRAVVVGAFVQLKTGGQVTRVCK